MAETNARPEPGTMKGVIPYLTMQGNAGAAADFYVRAFGAADAGRLPLDDVPGKFMHVQVTINGGALMMTDYGMSSATHDPPCPADTCNWWWTMVRSGGTVRSPQAAPSRPPMSASSGVTTGACCAIPSASSGRS